MSIQFNFKNKQSALVIEAYDNHDEKRTNTIHPVI
jgi:hypothetical protein